MATKMAVAALLRSQWRSPLLVVASLPVFGVPFLSFVKAGSTKVHPRELEIYDPVEQSKDILKLNEEEVSEFEQKVSSARKFVWGWTSSVQEGVAKVRQRFSLVEQKSLDFVELLQTDQEFQKKVGAISAAVFSGAVLAGRGRRPIRRILYSGVLGTTALAICYPKHAVDITLANYDRLKAFTNQQIGNFYQKRAEQPFVKEVLTPVEQTVEREGQAEVAENVAESASVNETGKEGEAFVLEEKVAQPEDAVEDKPKSLWSKIPFIDKLVDNKEESVVSPAAASKQGNESKVEETEKDQVVVLKQQQPPRPAKQVEGDIGQSNPEDKDMYSTRS